MLYHAIYIKIEHDQNHRLSFKDDIFMLLAARKDVRIAVASELYKRGEISFGKACEIASVDIEEMKEHEIIEFLVDTNKFKLVFDKEKEELTLERQRHEHPHLQLARHKEP